MPLSFNNDNLNTGFVDKAPAKVDEYNSLRMFGPAELAAQAEQDVLEKAALSNSMQVESSLIGYCKKTFEDARQARDTANVSTILLDAQRRRFGEYDPETTAQLIQQGGTRIWMKITEVKCNGAEAWMSDAYAPYGQKIWSLEPTPIPDLPSDIKDRIIQTVMSRVQQDIAAGMPMQTPEEIYNFASQLRKEVESEVKDDAKKKSKEMEKLINDQLTEADFQKVFEDFRSNVITFGTGIMKGPIVKQVRNLKWVNGQPVPSEELALLVENVSPFDFYPSPDAVEVEDGYMIQRSMISRTALQQMMSLPGYKTDQIKEVLTKYTDGLMQILPYDQQRHYLELKPQATLNKDHRIEMYEYWGPIPGRYLEEFGEKVADPEKDYDYQIIWIDSYPIKIMQNPDPLGRRPYYKCVYKKIAGSFWGCGVPRLMKDAQDIANGAGRALVNNMSIASGPQVMIDVSRLPPGEKITSLYPWKVWQFENPSGLTSRAIDFFQPNNNTQELLVIYDKAVRISEDETGIPAYAYGGDAGSGAGRTATGLSMLMNAAARGIKEVIGRIDSDVIRPLIERIYVWNMMYVDDPNIKGDCKVNTKGSMGLMLLELRQARLQEFTNMTANPMDMQLIGMPGRAKLLRENAELQNIDTNGIIPTEEQIEMQEKIKQQQAIQQQQMLMAQQGVENNTSPIPNASNQNSGGFNTAGTPPKTSEQPI